MLHIRRAKSPIRTGKNKTLAYYSSVPLSEKEQEELTEEERIRRRNTFLDKQFRS